MTKYVWLFLLVTVTCFGSGYLTVDGTISSLAAETVTIQRKTIFFKLPKKAVKARKFEIGQRATANVPMNQNIEMWEVMTPNPK